MKRYLPFTAHNFCEQREMGGERKLRYHCHHKNVFIPNVLCFIDVIVRIAIDWKRVFCVFLSRKLSITRASCRAFLELNDFTSFLFSYHSLNTRWTYCICEMCLFHSFFFGAEIGHAKPTLFLQPSTWFGFSKIESSSFLISELNILILTIIMTP